MTSFGFLAIFGQAFSCHFNAPSFYRQANESEKDYKKVTIYSFLLMLIMNGMIAFFSFVNFGYHLALDAPCILYFVNEKLTQSETQAGYPKLYPIMVHFGNVALIAMSINLAIGFGIVLHPTRIALNKFHDFISGKQSEEKISYVKHIILTSVICALVVSISCLLVFLDGFSALGKVVNFITSTFCVIISVILPAMMYLAMKSRSPKKKILPYATILIGVLTGVAGLMKFGKSMMRQ